VRERKTEREINIATVERERERERERVCVWERERERETACGGGTEQKTFLKSFCKSQFPHKSVNLFCISVIVREKLTGLWGS
jgi:diaminopimelate epimerase